MSSHRAKNKINVSASFVDTLNWSLFIQQKATMRVVTACVVTLSPRIWKEDRKDNDLCRTVNLMVASVDLDPYRHKSTYFSCSACCVDVTSHLLPLNTVLGNIVLLNQI